VKPLTRLLAVMLTLAVLAPACSSSRAAAPKCDAEDDPWILVAQTVPSATYLPCLRALPTGWSISGFQIERGSYTAWLDSDRAGARAVRIRLTRTCDVSNAVEIPVPDAPPGVRTYEQPIALPPAFAADRFLRFPGGCITYEFRFSMPAPAAAALEVQQALGVRPREDVRRALARIGLTLCGAGAPPCPG
jgi:hypothetical protein